MYDVKHYDNAILANNHDCIRGMHISPTPKKNLKREKILSFTFILLLECFTLNMVSYKFCRHEPSTFF